MIDGRAVVNSDSETSAPTLTLHTSLTPCTFPLATFGTISLRNNYDDVMA